MMQSAKKSWDGNAVIIAVITAFSSHDFLADCIITGLDNDLMP